VIKQDTVRNIIISRKTLSKAKLLALGLVFIFWASASFSQSIDILSSQLKQAVDSKNWSQAIEIIDRMIAIKPKQAGQLRSYKSRLQNLLKSDIQPVSAPIAPPKKYVPQESRRNDDLIVSQVRIETENYGSAGDLNYLVGRINNRSQRKIYNIQLSYDLFHYFREYNSSGTILIGALSPVQSQEFKYLLPNFSNPRMYKPSAIVISQIQWTDENLRINSDNFPRRFETSW
jgi:hypothetical protein